MNHRELLNEIIGDEDFQKLHRLLNRESIFSIMRIEERELVHTHLLAWLLNPLAGHGMGSIPLRSFFSMVASAVLKQKAQFGDPYATMDFIDPVSLSSFDLEALRVQTEYGFGHQTKEREKRGRTDVFVFDKSAEGEVVPYLIIEYKINAIQTTNQTERYASFVRGLALRPLAAEGQKLQPLMAYVCKEPGTDNIAKPFVVIRYPEFKGWVDLLKSLSTKTEQGKMLVEEFSVVLETFAAGTGESQGLVSKLITRYKPKRKFLSANTSEEDEDPVVMKAWDEYEETLEQIHLRRKTPQSPEMQQWSKLLSPDNREPLLDPEKWQVKGDNCKMIANRPFRQWILRLTGQDTRNPRLQLYIDARGSVALAFYYNRKKAVGDVLQKLPPAEFPKLVQSLRESLRQIEGLTELGVMVVDPDSTGDKVALVKSDCGTPSLSEQHLVKSKARFEEVVHKLEDAIDAWLASNA